MPQDERLAAANNPPRTAGTLRPLRPNHGAVEGPVRDVVVMRAFGGVTTTWVQRPTAARELGAATLDLPLVVALGAIVLRKTRGPRQRMIVLLAASAVYVVVPTAVLGGTVGQALVGLQVVDLSSRKKVDWTQVALRWTADVGLGVLTIAALRNWYQAGRARRMSVMGDVLREMDELADQHNDRPDQLEAEALALYKRSFSPTFADTAFLTVVLATRLIVVPRIRDRLTKSVVAVRRA